MRVALDGTPLSVPTGGIRRYTIELSRALRECFTEDHFELFSDQLVKPRGWLARRWWMFGLNRELARWGADLFHGTEFSVPYSRSRPSILTLHDLSPWVTEEASSRVRRRAPFLMRHIATMIITPSEAIRRAAIERFGLNSERVVSVPHAAASNFRPVLDKQQDAYFLYVGTLERRKNINTLVQAFSEVAGPELWLAGRIRPGFEFQNGPNVRILGAVPDDALPQLYSGALAVVYPSLYEGFGLPVLEAMQCGAPVIASTDPAIREVAGDAALLLDPLDTRAWKEAMRNAAVNPEWRSERRARGLVRAREFSWERTARLTHSVYQEALNRHGR
jgi:glycosyltransferase involved in cell wall biosynthesis